MTEAPTCTFSELVPLFQELYAPDARRLLPLVAKMKQFIRHGSCANAMPSRRGAHARYSMQDVRELLFLMELSHLGIPVSKAWDMFSAYEWDAGKLVHEVKLSSTGIGRIVLHEKPLLAAAYRHLPRLFARAA